MNSRVVLALVLVGLATGCKRYGGDLSANYANPDHQTFTVVESQRDQTGNPIFAIAYIKTNGASSGSTQSENGLITAINGHPIHPSLDHRAVYAFQPDASLKQIPLADDQIATLFREMQDSNFHTSYSKLWQKEIAPFLTNGPAILK